MNIEQLKSGSYRIRQTYKGHKYSVTVPYKPTIKEATILIAKLMEEEPEDDAVDEGNVEYYAQKYIEKREKEDLSPATIRGYLSIVRNTPKWFLKLSLFDVTNKDVQKLVNEYKKNHSPKSTRLLYGFYRPVFKEYRSQFVMRAELPALIKKIEYQPTTDDVRRIIEAAEGTRYSIPLKLCVLGLRKGEVFAISEMDIDKDCVLTISKDMVIDKNNNKIVKNHPKTSASYRRIPIDKDLAAAIKAQGYAYNGGKHGVNRFLNQTQKKLGIPHFRLHMLRHFCAAHLHKQGFSDEEVMGWLGWDDPSTMARIYRYNLDPAENMSAIKDSFKRLSV